MYNMAVFCVFSEFWLRKTHSLQEKIVEARQHHYQNVNDKNSPKPRIPRNVI